MLFGETAGIEPAPGDGPADWKKHFLIPAGIGVGCVLIAAVVGQTVAGTMSQPSAALSTIRAVLCIGGLVAMGIAVWLRPRAVPLLAVACATCLVAWFGFSPDWDSGRMVAGFLAIISGIGAILMALPTLYRQIGVSLLLLFHFGNLVACVTGPPTGNVGSPWLSRSATVMVFRPYSEFLYLFNAYHFYSPDPGPASQVWFCIYYDDGKEIETKNADGKMVKSKEEGSKRWFKLPRRPEDMRDPLALSYYRRLSLTMQLENYQLVLNDEVENRRNRKAFGENGIPWHPQLAHSAQFRAPAEAIRLFLIPSYVRHVANLPLVQHDQIDPATGKPYAITKIKVYRVEHSILPAIQMLMADPYSPATYLPFYQGEYYADGRVTDPNDPMLFWLVPIFYIPKDPINSRFDNPKTHPEKFELYDGLAVHTHSDPNLK